MGGGFAILASFHVLEAPRFALMGGSRDSSGTRDPL